MLLLAPPDADRGLCVLGSIMRATIVLRRLRTMYQLWCDGNQGTTYSVRISNVGMKVRWWLEVRVAGLTALRPTKRHDWSIAHTSRLLRVVTW